MSKNPELYQNPYGLWKITTEGDVEGRSVKHLGTHEGYLDELALKFAHAAGYALTFKKIESHEHEAIPVNNKEAIVQLDIDSGTWDMKPDERVQFAAELLRDRPATAAKTSNYASFKVINDQRTDREKLEDELKEAGFDPEQVANRLKG